LTSMRMDALVPRLWLHVIARTLPTVHVTRVFGAVTVTVGAAIVKFASLVSLAPGLPVHVTRTRAVVVFGLVTGQVKAPVFATDGASVLHVAPPSRLSSTRMGAGASRLLVQVMDWTEPTPQFSAVFGEVTVTDALAIVKDDVATATLPERSRAVTWMRPWA